MEARSIWHILILGGVLASRCSRLASIQQRGYAVPTDLGWKYVRCRSGEIPLVPGMWWPFRRRATSVRHVLPTPIWAITVASRSASRLHLGELRAAHAKFVRWLKSRSASTEADSVVKGAPFGRRGFNRMLAALAQADVEASVFDFVCECRVPCLRIATFVFDFQTDGAVNDTAPRRVPRCSLFATLLVGNSWFARAGRSTLTIWAG